MSSLQASQRSLSLQSAPSGFQLQAQPGALTPEQAEIKARVDAINTGNRSGAIATFPGSISTAVQPPRISLAINTGTGQAHFDQPLPSPRGSSHSNSQQPLQQPTVQLPHHPQLQGQGSQPLRAPSPAVQPAQQAAVHAHQQPAVQPAVRALSPPAQQAGSYASQEGAAQQAQPAAVQFTPPASAAAAAGLQALQAFSNGQLTAGNPAQLQGVFNTYYNSLSKDMQQMFQSNLSQNGIPALQLQPQQQQQQQQQQRPSPAAASIVFPHAGFSLPAANARPSLQLNTFANRPQIPQQHPQQHRYPAPLTGMSTAVSTSAPQQGLPSQQHVPASQQHFPRGPTIDLTSSGNLAPPGGRPATPGGRPATPGGGMPGAGQQPPHLVTHHPPSTSIPQVSLSHPHASLAHPRGTSSAPHGMSVMPSQQHFQHAALAQRVHIQAPMQQQHAQLQAQQMQQQQQQQPQPPTFDGRVLGVVPTPTGGRVFNSVIGSPTPRPAGKLMRTAEIARLAHGHEVDTKLLEPALLELAEAFVEGACAFGCGMARRRKGKRLQPSDMADYLDRNWQVRVPGFLAEEVRPYKKLHNKGHLDRLHAVQQQQQQLQAQAVDQPAAKGKQQSAANKNAATPAMQEYGK